MEVVNRIEYDDTLLPQGSDLWLETRRKYGKIINPVNRRI